jgi:hypothetical protein
MLFPLSFQKKNSVTDAKIGILFNIKANQAINSDEAGDGQLIWAGGRRDDT